MIWRRRTDTPFERDPAARLLPWIIAVMVFLSALSVTGALLLQSAVQGWSRGLSGTLTVQLPNAIDGSPVGEDRVNEVANLLRGTAGITRVRILPRAEIVSMVRPWLGEAAAANDLPLPWLIDVGTADGAGPDLDDLRDRVGQAVPGATVENHQRWLRQLVDLVQGSLILTLGIVAMILLATVLTIIFAARTALRVHSRVTEVLHLIGAPDSYVARQFERQAFWLGFYGGFIGAAAAAATVFGLGELAGRVNAFNLDEFGLEPWQWAVFLAFPVVAALVARVTARITVMRTLAKMP